MSSRYRPADPYRGVKARGNVSIETFTTKLSGCLTVPPNGSVVRSWEEKEK